MAAMSWSSGGVPGTYEFRTRMPRALTGKAVPAPMAAFDTTRGPKAGREGGMARKLPNR